MSVAPATLPPRAGHLWRDEDHNPPKIADDNFKNGRYSTRRHAKLLKICRHAACGIHRDTEHSGVVKLDETRRSQKDHPERTPILEGWVSFVCRFETFSLYYVYTCMLDASRLSAPCVGSYSKSGHTRQVGVEPDFKMATHLSYDAI